jgi:predicted GNAT family acetyltransferase
MVDLSSADLPQMSALYEATRPGRKLSPGLIGLGGFVGMKENGQLQAMACLRLHFPGYREISTVGTLPGHTGRGYATALVAELVRRIRAAGETPFLTVRTDNERAIAIYRRLGFREHGRLHSTTVASIG